jgi:hypothetical protein
VHRRDDELIGMVAGDGPPRFVFLGSVIKVWKLPAASLLRKDTAYEKLP